MQNNHPLTLKPRTALGVAVVMYGALAAWHFYMIQPCPEMLVPRFWIILACTFVFCVTAAGLFPWLASRDLSGSPRRYRIIQAMAFVLFFLGSRGISVIWEVKLTSQVPHLAFVQEQAPDEADWKASVKEGLKVRQQVISKACRPVKVCGTITCALVVAAARFFRPDPAGEKSEQGQKPPPLPMAEGMQSRVVADKWWAKYY